VISPSSSKHGWRIGRVIPGLLALVALADVGSRFFSIEPLTFRAWEAVSRNRVPGAAFEPNRRYHRERAYGDAAAMGNLRYLAQYHPETFTTDAYGFRNVGLGSRAPFGVILAGDSFAVGSGVSDDETLSATLSALVGCGVYNAAGMEFDPDRLRGLARKLDVRRGLILHEYAEDADLPTVPSRRKLTINRMLTSATEDAGRVVGRVRGFLLVSPLQILSERVFKRISNDRVLPNAYASNVVKGSLQNGDAMLFLASKVSNAHRRRDVSAAYWTWMQAELRKSDLDLLVVLIPSKYTVYRPFLIDQPPLDVEAAGYLDRLEDQLRAVGVPVLNLTPALTAQAARDVDAHKYLYRRDDIHWNGEGIRLAATAMLGDRMLAESACRERPAAIAAREPSAISHGH